MLFPGKGFSLLSSHFAYLIDFITSWAGLARSYLGVLLSQLAWRPIYATAVLMSLSKGVCKTLRRVEYSQQDPQKLVTATL